MSTPSTGQNDKFKIPTLSELRNKSLEVFGIRPCLWQLRVALAVIRNDRDVISVSATGSGKTLTFWLPLLYRKAHTQIIVTPINLLGKQNVETLKKLGIEGVAITGETPLAEKQRIFREIEAGKYGVVVTNVETLKKEKSGFDCLWKNPAFTSRLLSFIWDEGHCASKWASFRPDYKDVFQMRHLLPEHVRFFVTSATLPSLVLEEVKQNLGIQQNPYLFFRSNDRHNVHIVVRKLQYAQNSFQDLAFLIPNDWKPGDPPPKKFLVFFDNKNECIAAAEFLRARLPAELKDKIKWFSADMTQHFREGEAESLKEGITWGLTCTDSFGMGMDMPDIEIVVQRRATCDFCTLKQRFGRGARNLSLECTALFLVEPKYFDEEREKSEKKKQENLAKRLDAQKSKETTGGTGTLSSRKRKAAPTASDKDEPNKRLCAAQSPSRNVLTPTSTHNVPCQVMENREDGSGDCQLLSPRHAMGNTDGITQDSRDVSLSLTDHHRERAALYKLRPFEPKGKARGRPTDLEPALDDLVNAETRGFGCFRLPESLYFATLGLASDHLECDPDLPEGCPRCKYHKPRLCCSGAKCSYGILKSFGEVVYTKPPGKPQKSRAIETGYKPSARDMELGDALHRWRRAETIRLHGWAIARDLGSSLVMADSVLDRLVDCVRAGKVHSVADISKETRWVFAEQHGPTVLSIINEHRPQAETPPVASLSNANASSDPTKSQSSAVKQRKKPECKACGATDHIRSNKKCPKHPSHSAENAPPKAVSPPQSSVRSTTHHSVNGTPSPQRSRPAPRPIFRQRHHLESSENNTISSSIRDTDNQLLDSIPASSFYGH